MYFAPVGKLIRWTALAGLAAGLNGGCAPKKLPLPLFSHPVGLAQSRAASQAQAEPALKVDNPLLGENRPDLPPLYKLEYESLRKFAGDNGLDLKEFGVNPDDYATGLSESDTGYNRSLLEIADGHVVALRVWFKPISDISALSGLTGLRDLELNETRVSEIGALSKLVKLEKLSLFKSPVEDLGPLSNLTGLVRLNLIETRVNDLTPLSRLHRLKVLDLGWTSIRDISAIKFLHDLESLSMQATPVEDISPLTGLKKLNSLQVGDGVNPEDVAGLQRKKPDLRVSYY
jgi:hypothetical protein